MLKKAILNFKAKRILKKRSQELMTDFKSSQKIAIIYSDLFENEKQISEIVNELKKEGKEISMMVYCHSIKKKTTALPHFHSKEISLTGEIKSEDLNFFLRQSYDFALCFDQSRHFIIDYVFSQVKAKCRVGIRAPSRDHLFEMMIQADDQQTPLSSEVLRYLKMIQSYEY